MEQVLDLLLGSDIGMMSLITVVGTIVVVAVLIGMLIRKSGGA